MVPFYVKCSSVYISMECTYLPFLHKKKRTLLSEESSFLLGYPDSNQERQDQNLQCYHYTIAQSICFAKGAHVLYALFLVCECKGKAFF